MNLNEHREWMQRKGFVEQADGSWSKPKRVVPRVRPEAVAVAKPDTEHARDVAPPRKAIYPGRVLVCITSYCCGEQRDSRNIFDKYGLDCCRYAGLIFDDSPKWIDLIVKETRVPTKKEEGFEIVITPL